MGDEKRRRDGVCRTARVSRQEPHETFREAGRGAVFPVLPDGSIPPIFREGLRKPGCYLAMGRAVSDAPDRPGASGVYDRGADIAMGRAILTELRVPFRHGPQRNQARWTAG